MKKKLLSILLALSLMLALVPTAFAADIVDSGTCGADGDGSSVTWTLDAAGLLTISGTGKIIGGDGGSIWSGKPVMAVDIRSGITAVGSNAFYGCGSAAGHLPAGHRHAARQKRVRQLRRTLEHPRRR